MDRPGPARPSHHPLFGFGLFLALILFGYSSFHGLVNAADPVRMATNVQDLAVLMLLTFSACATSQLRQLTVRLLRTDATPALVGVLPRL